MPSEDYRWIDCQGCDGEVGVPPDWNEHILNCPSCGASVQVKRTLLYRQKATQASSGEPSSPSVEPMAQLPCEIASAPKWMKPWGWLLTWLGIVGFFASTYLNWRDGHEGEAIIFGFLNPMCFVGLPIGLYWLTRSGVNLGRVLTAINESTLSEGERTKRGS
jgi:hypothetical protein